jgi:hypothetical protein
MVHYLLPCSCGRQVPVSASMAGQQVRCDCGSELEVPTLRHLGHLPRDEHASLSPKHRTWTPRQQRSFVFLVLGLGAGLLAAYLAWRMPQAPVIIPAREVDQQVIDASTPDDIHTAFEELKKGIKPRTQAITPEAVEAIEQRKLFIWGIRLVLALGTCLLAAGVAAILLGHKAPRGG